MYLYQFSFKDGRSWLKEDQLYDDKQTKQESVFDTFQNLLKPFDNGYGVQYPCTASQCEYKSTDKANLNKHVESIHESNPEQIQIDFNMPGFELNNKTGKTEKVLKGCH